MDLLDIPVVKAVLLCIALASLVLWVVKQLSPARNAEKRAARREVAEMLVAELSAQERGEIRNCLDRGRKIEARRHLRAATHSGLREAKDAVELMTDVRRSPA